MTAPPSVRRNTGSAPHPSSDASLMSQMGIKSHWPPLISLQESWQQPLWSTVIYNQNECYSREWFAVADIFIMLFGPLFSLSEGTLSNEVNVACIFFCSLSVLNLTRTIAQCDSVIISLISQPRNFDTHVPWKMWNFLQLSSHGVLAAGW